MSSKRVVVTGLGTTSPVGGDVPSTWDALVNGRSGVRYLTDDWAEELPVKIAGRIAVEPTEVLERVKARRLDRSAQFAMVAAMEAWADAGLDVAQESGDLDDDRVGVAMASGIGGVTTLLDNYDTLKAKGPRRVSPLAVPMLMPNAPAANDQPVRRRARGGQHAGLGVRVRQRGDRPRDRPDPARPRRRRRRRRHRGGDPPAADGGVRQHDGALEDRQRRGRRRPDHGLPALGHRPRRLRARRGRRRARARVRGARQGPRGADLRDVLGAGITADSHDIAQPDPAGRGGARAILRALAEARHQPRRHRPRQRARDVDPAGRHRRGPDAPRDPRLARHRRRGHQHQVDDRAPARRRRRARGGRDGARAPPPDRRRRRSTSTTSTRRSSSTSPPRSATCRSATSRRSTTPSASAAPTSPSPSDRV